MNNLIFIAVSMFEAFSAFAIMLTIFRFKFRDYFKYLFPASAVMSVMSYLIWMEFGLENYAAIIFLFCFTLFNYHILRTSLFGAAIVTITGNVSSFVVQTSYIFLLEKAGLIEMEGIQNQNDDYFLMSVLSSVTLILISRRLYRTGYGFTYSLDRFTWRLDNGRLKRENWLVLLVMIISALFLAALQYFVGIFYLAGLAALIIVYVLVHLSVKKEQGHD